MTIRTDEIQRPIIEQDATPDLSANEQQQPSSPTASSSPRSPPQTLLQQARQPVIELNLVDP
jgi:hypothetical protein